MTMELDVFVGNTSLIDEEVYQLWLDGYSVSDAVCRRSQSGILEQASATSDVLGSDTMDHYRTFQMLERLLHHPTKLVNQLLFQIPPHMQALLIENSVGFRDVTRHWVLGPGLKKKKKKNQGGVTKKQRITEKLTWRYHSDPEQSCSHGVFMQGTVVLFLLCHTYWLSTGVAGDYAAIVFFANNRFETGKKKLQYLTFEDFAYCAEQMIQNWTLGAVDSMVDDMDVDLDKEFLQDLKDLKVLVTDKDLLDQHKSLVCTALRGKISNFTEMEASFKKIDRYCVAVKMSIIYFTWVFFFFFPPLCECMKQFIEPCKSEKWTINDVRLFLTQYTNSARALDAFRYHYICLLVVNTRCFGVFFGNCLKRNSD
uniref:FGF1 intracellular binding protein n=1 Tax=Latimeria chalumnae TaxID=7897 RepID=H3B071_LATCH